MTIEEAIANLKAVVGETWPRTMSLPEQPMIALCEAFWLAGQQPNTKTIAPYFPGTSTRSFVSGIEAWRRQRGFKAHAKNPLISKLEDLIPHIAAEIGTAPLTCFDPANDGRWPIPPPKVIGYIRRIENPSLRNAMVLYASLKDLSQYQFYARIVSFTSAMRMIMKELGYADITTIDPDDMFRRLLEEGAVRTVSTCQRSRLSIDWNSITNCFDDYAERLSVAQREVMAKFFLRRIVDRRRISKTAVWPAWQREQQARVKAKTDVVHSRFHHLRHLARLRLNQIRRMHHAAGQAIAQVKTNGLSLPHHFSYEETATLESGRTIRLRVHMGIWDMIAIWDRLVELGYHSIDKSRLRKKCAGEFSLEGNSYHVEYCRTESLESGATPTEPWFLELCDYYVFSKPEQSDLISRRLEFYQRWGYDSSDQWYLPMRVVGWGHHLAQWSWLREKGGHRLFSTEALLVAALFGQLAIRVQTITGARLGEVQQIAQSPECIKQLVNVGPKASTRWLLRLIPKGETQRRDFYIDEDTKNDIMEVVRLLREKTQAKKIPIINPEFNKTPPDRYLFQWDGKALDQCVLNSVIRFLLHGAVVRATDGQGVHLTSHILRHAFATEMAGLKVSVDVIAQLLHQRDTSVTKYYSRPTATQVMEAAEMVFVDRIDLAAEVLRSPSEISRMLTDAEGQVGALTEVIGGTCVVANLCPAKFACIGCAGNAPDPAKRYQVEQKIAWAREHAGWSVKEGLLPEERRLKQLIQDCELMLEEMTLIENARADALQQIQISSNCGLAHE